MSVGQAVPLISCLSDLDSASLFAQHTCCVRMLMLIVRQSRCSAASYQPFRFSIAVQAASCKSRSAGVALIISLQIPCPGPVSLDIVHSFIIEDRYICKKQILRIIVLLNIFSKRLGMLP